MSILALIECNTSNTLRIFFILKFIIAVIIVIVPVITVIKTSFDLVKKIVSKDVGSDVISNFLKKIVACMLVFLVIPIHNSILKSLGENSLESSSCWVNATKDYIDALRVKEVEQRLAEKEARRLEQEAKYQEFLRQEEEYRKQEALNQEKKEDESITPPSVSYDGSSENGTWGLLQVKNGVFYLPNRRATKNSETPVQEGYKGLNPIFWKRLNNLINDAADRGCKVTISSGHRSYSTQLSTWNNNHRSCPERCSWVAYPGGSRHNFGIAADLRFNGTSCSEGPYDCNSCAKWVHDNASKYGLKFRLSNEPWHIEPSKVEGGNYASCRSICKKKL